MVVVVAFMVSSLSAPGGGCRSLCLCPFDGLSISQINVNVNAAFVQNVHIDVNFALWYYSGII